MGTNRGWMPGWLYWVLVVALVGFGYLALLSIGFPFLALGLTLAVLYPVRGRRTIVWPVVAGVGSFFLSYVLVAPLSCSTSSGGVAEYTPALTLSAGSTECFNLLGIDYSGGDSYNPSLLPGLVAGLVVAVTVALLTWLVIRRRTAPSQGSPART